MERTREGYGLIVTALVVAAALASWGGGVLPAASAAPSPPDVGAPVDADVQAKVADGPVDVIVVTDAPGAQVAAAVMDAVPDDSASAVEAGATSQLAVTVDAEGLEALRRSPHVERIVENGKNFVSADAWAETIGHDAGWDGGGQTIAVLDSGVESSHPYLAGKVVAEACFSSVSTPGIESLCPGGGNVEVGVGAAAPCTVPIAECGHGTHVAGIAAGGPVTTGGRVIEGVAPAASIVAVQVFTKGTTTTACSGPAPCVFAYTSDLNEALFWLRTQVQDAAPGFTQLAAVNLSLGGGLSAGTCDDDPIKPYVDELALLGVATVAATGNLGFNSTAFPGSSAPACISSVVSVGATAATSALASYSNLIQATTILAPGGPITSSRPGSSYGPSTGTSMSTPMVSGAIALLKQQGYTTTASMVNRLTMTGNGVPTSFGMHPEISVGSALLGVPNRPGGLAALPGEGYVDVTWSEPTFTGDGPLSGYAVTSEPASAGCTTSGATTCRVPGLVNGTGYTFTVQSIGSGGPGGQATVAGMPRTVPGAPGPVTVAPANQAVAVTWSAPTANGGAPITGYRATAQPEARSYATTGALSCTITGLTNGATYTVTVVAENEAGTGPSSSPSAPVSPVWGPSLPSGPPIGSLDVALGGPRSVMVGGWALDPDEEGPIQVHVYVDGVGVAVTADGSRPDVAAAFPGYAAARGFDVAVSASAGPHTVCAYGINVGPGGHSVLGCRRVTVPSGPPIGSLDVAVGGPRSVMVGGWALDPDEAGPIQVHVYVDGVGVAVTADGSRPDVAAAFPGFGAARGFDVAVSASAGPHTVCAYGINVGPGGHSVLGCRRVTVPSGPPIGSLDVAVPSPGSVTVGGWALDPDEAGPIQVHVYVDGFGVAVTADGSRPDVAAAFPGFGAGHGFGVAVSASAGPRGLRLYGINVGPGGHSLLGCRQV